MTVFQDILVLQNEVCYYGNQLISFSMSCNNTKETVPVYDPLHLDNIFALTK